ncbi:M14 metallopeptidase family protein [Sphingobacterium bovistauri]|uniref:Zinc carboxypeptidase n=1 Tax=Sphingobacterium bovistauri TaxID=2781959 RepID=A0ABS7Z1Y0_9SPHI|nr:M14 metallopeptidase family protein [Sphingobacterium bovistauri]MCA5004178.1 zinc carboxypeptidase [Sphingobacterium bovistauri]
MKKILSIILTVCISTVAWAQLQSPEEFLGRQIGTKITPHWKVLEYYKHVATQAPEQVKFQQYGESIEGRPMYVFFVSSAKNIARLEDIRKSNLQIAGELSGNTLLTDMPAVIWMSNNAHGNETSSMESSMKTLYQLVNPKNASIQKQLENSLVIIDPCLNPDGTERYNNWQNGILGVKYHPDLYAREHNEPWPGGRVNHYYFDLNRDWAWQTQLESQQRMKIYNAWLPHIHIDFHEMGINAPYYFPPAAEPLHEVITPWQREFQTTIGKHNAKYFDQQGWLYFTKERFDLFYPSYGDTYPMYSGAIGMTYEKAGNSSAGLGVYTDQKDTLTLVDRVIQHHASGMNLVEVVSQNSQKVVEEFKKFYKQANGGELATFQSYVVKYDVNSEGRIRSLLDLLDKNNIRYYAAEGVFKGIDFATKKNTTYTAKEKDLVVPGNQPKAALVRVLFEPEAKLVDSVTYDITAWSMPYVYGLSAIASQTKISSVKAYSLEKISNALEDSFGYAIKWNGFNSAQVLTSLLQHKITVKRSEYAFKLKGEDFPRGSLLVMSSNNKSVDVKKALKIIADENAVKIYTINSGIIDGAKDFGSSDVKTIKAPKVLMLAGEGQRSLNVGEVWHYFDQQLKYPIILVNPKDISRIKWTEIDVFIMPSGSYPFLNDKSQSDNFANWVRAGGKVIAIESAIAQLSIQSWVKIKPMKQDTTAKAKESPLKVYGDRERESLKEYTAGAIYKVDFDATHPLMYGNKEYYTLRQEGTLYQYFKDGAGWNVGYIKENALMSGFVGQHLSKQIKNGLVFGTESVGAGTIVYLADNVLFRNFWDSGKLVMANAVFQVD